MGTTTLWRRRIIAVLYTFDSEQLNTLANQVCEKLTEEMCVRGLLKEDPLLRVVIHEKGFFGKVIEKLWPSPPDSTYTSHIVVVSLKR